MKTVLLLVCVCIFIHLVNAYNGCANVTIPNASNCKCYSKKNWSIKIQCDRKGHVDFNLDLAGSNVDTLEIDNAEFSIMRDNIIINTTLKKLILRNIFAFFVSIPPFYGILSGGGETLQMLEIYDSWTTFSWKVNQFGRLKTLTHLAIVNSPAYYEDFGVSDLESLEYLELRNVEMVWLREDNFSGLRNLRILSLSKNQLKSITRSMFPRPAEHLWHLDFSYNKLTELEKNIFDDMKQLREIRLDHNELKTLPKDLFSNIGWQLTDLWIHDNELSCRKETEWMKNLNLPVYTWIAQCRSKSQRRNRL